MAGHATDGGRGTDLAAVLQRLGATRDGRFNAGELRLSATRAVVWYHADGTVHTFSADEMNRRVGEFAAAFAALGVRRGRRVAALIGRRPAAFATCLATWRLGAVHVPLSPGLPPAALRARLVDCAPELIVTDAENRPALAAVQDAVPAARVLLTNGRGESSDHPVADVLATEPPVPGPVETRLGDPATILYPDTGPEPPVGCVLAHRAVATFLPYLRHGPGVAAGDVLLAGADAGSWTDLLATGLAPMIAGVTRVVYADPFTADGWWSCVHTAGVTHLAADAATLGALATAGGGEPIGADRSAVRRADVVGAPLPPGLAAAFARGTGVPLGGGFGLPETGMVMVDSRGSQVSTAAGGVLGRPLPGRRVCLLSDDGTPVRGEGTGRIAVADDLLPAVGYWGRDDEWRARFVDGWFVTDHRAHRDAAGHYVAA